MKRTYIVGTPKNIVTAPDCSSRDDVVAVEALAQHDACAPAASVPLSPAIKPCT